jgi:hypothetical protein
MSDNETTQGVIHFAMEVPTNHLDWFEPFQRFYMALAPEVLKNPTYAAWHLRQSIGLGAPVALGNGSNEYGKSLSPDQLIAAAYQVGADVIIAPDFMDDADRTVGSCKEFIQGTHLDGIVGACQGKTLDAQISCFQQLIDLSVMTVGFSWKLPRVEIIRQLASDGLLDERRVYMLLGFKSFEELQEIVSLGPWLWLFDTGEPIKAALRMTKMMREYKPLHEVYPLGPEITLSGDQLLLATQNIAMMGALVPRFNDTSPFENSEGDEGDDS